MIIDEQKKVDALFEHLILAYNQYKKGSSQQINTIIEQVIRPNKQTAQIVMWMEQFNKLVLQQAKLNCPPPQILFDAVLYQMPWFTSENHIKALPSFKKFVFTMLCAQASMIENIYQVLVSKLNINDTNQSEIDQKVQVRIQLNNRIFSDKQTLIEEVQKILSSVEVLGEGIAHPLEQRDQDLMHELFKYHPNSLGKLNGMFKIGVGYFPATNPTKCFYLIKQDNSVEDISYVKSIDLLIENLNVEVYMQHYQQHQEHFHNIIKMIAELDRLNRLYQGRLLDLLSSAFPHKSKHEFLLKAYISNLLNLGDAIPTIRPKLIKMIVLRLISIDAEIKVETQLKGTPKRIQPEKDLMYKKLDHLMLVLFEYFSDRINNNSLDIQQWTNVFSELMKIFQENILKNQQSRLVHFLFLFLCGQEKLIRLQQIFLTRLVLNVQETGIGRKQKINSIFYLSSLLLRCRGLKPSVVQRTQEILLKQVEYLLTKATQCEKLNILHNQEILLYLIQMFAQLIGNGLRSKNVAKILVEANQEINALSFCHCEVLIKLNDSLLRLPASQQNEWTEKLIEISAGLLSRLFEKNNTCETSRDQSPNFLSCTTMNNDYESYNSRHSTWTISNKRGIHQKPSDLDFIQPFSSIPFIVSLKYLRKYHVQDFEIAQNINPTYEEPQQQFVKQKKIISEQKQAKRKANQIPQEYELKLTKKIK